MPLIKDKQNALFFEIFLLFQGCPLGFDLVIGGTYSSAVCSIRSILADHDSENVFVIRFSVVFLTTVSLFQ